MKNQFLNRLNNWLVYIFLSCVVGSAVLGTYFLVDYLRKEEIQRIELFATAMKYQQDTVQSSSVVLELILQISKSNTSIPVIVTDGKGRPIGRDLMKNIPEDIMGHPIKLQELLDEMKNTYPPFELKLPNGNQYVYYTNSRLLNILKYSPLYIGAVVLGYIIFSLWFLHTSKKTDEGFLWAGLAKETAHQIGTPLSSMIGWIEILRIENFHSEGVNEIEKDISRLKTITERFSKIGSVPELNDMNLSETLQQNFDYLKGRISSKIQFSLHMPKSECLLPHSRILMSWVVENIVKNAVDAMKGVGKLEITLYEKNGKILIDFKDSGMGMTKRQARNVFKPGYSTKKRGWGLGLSLAKRVISEYHSGDLRVVHTELGQGSVFRIIFKTDSDGNI